MNKLLILTSLLISLSTFANAWYCESYSPSGSGWGSSQALYIAQSRAVYHCRTVTPNNQFCSPPSCW